MQARLRELFREESGQDLVEYGLLAVFLVLASLVVWLAVADAIGTAYGGYNSGIQDLWESPEPPGPPPG